MGLRMSIDKHVSSLDELLDMSAVYFNKIKFEAKVSPEIAQHLKVSSLPPNARAFARSGNFLRTSQNSTQ